jgi:hypothetical protein
MPSNKPAPRTDSTNGLFESSNLRVSSSSLFLARRFSLSRTDIAARADAQAIGFPTESYSISTEELQNGGGYLMGYVSGNRTSYGSQNKLDIYNLHIPYSQRMWFHQY